MRGPSPAPGAVPMGPQALQGQVAASGKSGREDGALPATPVALGDARVTPPRLSHRDGLLDVLHRIVQLTQEDDCVSPACPQPSHPYSRSPSAITMQPPCRGAVQIPPSTGWEQNSLPPTAIQTLLLLFSSV